jgi:peptidoglycan/xylan/chitin deacetylase (PgdA/CDA1 family)
LFVKTPKFIQRIFHSIVWRKENSQNNIWLTFDDGPSPEVTPFILKTLKEEKIKATFFLIGQQIEKHQDLFDKIITDGHVVANHSYSHKNGWKSNLSNYLNDIEECQKLMPKNKLFRPPYGKVSPLKIKHINKKYTIILWDIFSWDFQLNNRPQEIKENVLKHTTSGSIIVFHNNKQSLNKLKIILKETIQELKEKGFLFSTTW